VHEMMPMDPPRHEPWQVEMLERRRIVFEQLLWQIPSASFAGQAFLLTIVLGTAASGLSRLVAALFGFGAAVAVLVAYVKHRYTEEAYAEWINSTEMRAGRPKLITPEILRDAYLDRDQGDVFGWKTRLLRPLTRLSAFETWALLLSLFVVGDLVLVLMSIVEVAGGGTLLD
jgi:hypothetical protein